MKTATKERGIMFSGPMMRALLEDRKSQTRRTKDLGTINERPHEWLCRGIEDGVAYFSNLLHSDGDTEIKSPYGQPGDRLWVRETWCGDRFNGVGYKATDAQSGPWRPSIFMPRWASRITLEITDVRVERVQSISEMDALAEGIEELEQGPPMERFWAPDGDDGHHSAANAYAELWDSINGKTHPWASNPFVWAISFKRVEAANA